MLEHNITMAEVEIAQAQSINRSLKKQLATLEKKLADLKIIHVEKQVKLAVHRKQVEQIAKGIMGGVI